MTPIETVYFALVLFAALVALNTWKMRRDLTAVRMSRGLNKFVSGRTPQAVRAEIAEVEEDFSEGDDALVVQ